MFILRVANLLQIHFWIIVKIFVPSGDVLQNVILSYTLDIQPQSPPNGQHQEQPRLTTRWKELLVLELGDH